MVNIHDVEKAKKDFSAFSFNNFKKTDTNVILNGLSEKGYAVWLNSKANICIRKVSQSKTQEYTSKKAEIILSNILGKRIKIETNKSLEETKEKENIIHEPLADSRKQPII